MHILSIYTAIYNLKIGMGMKIFLRRIRKEWQCREEKIGSFL